MTKRRGGQNKRQEKRGRRERERDRERGGRKHKPEKKNRRSNPGKNTEKTRGTLENKWDRNREKLLANAWAPTSLVSGCTTPWIDGREGEQGSKRREDITPGNRKLIENQKKRKNHRETNNTGAENERKKEREKTERKSRGVRWNREERPEINQKKTEVEGKFWPATTPSSSSRPGKFSLLRNYNYIGIVHMQI